MRNLTAMALAACLVSGAALAVDDGQYYTLYTQGTASRSLTWHACKGGSCFASGELGPFRHACAVMAGKPRVVGNVETRAIYVVDQLRSPEPLHLFVYTRTDTFSDSGDDVEIAQRADLETDVASHQPKGGRCAMAGNEQILFVGLSGGGFVKVDKHTLAMSESTGEPISTITADNNGYLTLGTADGLFHTYDKNGFLVQSGSDTRFASDTRNAFVLP